MRYLYHKVYDDEYQLEMGVTQSYKKIRLTIGSNSGTN